jgi:DNA-binding LacI/PurR family transcriptional regulator
VAIELDCKARFSTPAFASSGAERAALVQRLKRANRRTALLCAEDNVALLLITGVREAGLSCPSQVGILSVMGTDFAARAGLSCLRYDFRKLGKTAVNALNAPAPVRHSIEPTLSVGQST